MKGLTYVLALAIALTTVPIGTAGPTTEPAGPSDQSAGAEVGTPVQQETAAIVINAPTKGRVGELIRFDLTKSVADSVKWIVQPATPDFETYEDGRRAVFSARTPGDYVFFISVAKGGTVDSLIHTVRIEGPPPKPETQSLADWIPYWLYPMQLNTSEAEILAASFEDTAARITALSTPKGIIEATAEANRAAMGKSLSKWKPLLKKIQAALANRAKAGTLTTPDQHKEAWLEIARGLRKYAT